MDINAHVKRAKGQAWFQRPLWPLLIALHCGATLLFFVLYAPQSRQHDGDSLQAGLSATEQDALGEANIIEQPVKKVIYAVRPVMCGWIDLVCKIYPHSLRRRRYGHTELRSILTKTDCWGPSSESYRMQLHQATWQLQTTVRCISSCRGLIPILVNR